MNKKPVYLVSCVKKKQDLSASAKDLYQSAWFRKARAYVEATGCRWFILSAEYGLLDPDHKVVPYNQSLKKMRLAERSKWAEKVLAEIEHKLPKAETIIFLAGKRYREFLEEKLKTRGHTVFVPMKGLSIGKQLQWLEHNRSIQQRSTPQQ